MSRVFSAEDEQLLARHRALAAVFDEAVQIPGTRLRFGLDALLGLFPGVGDLLGAGVAIYGITLARRLGAPTAVQLQMLGNVALDALGGAVPFFGDLFDFAFKAHARNRDLLQRWLDDPRPVARASRWRVVGVGTLVLAALASMLAALVFAFRLLLGS